MAKPLGKRQRASLVFLTGVHRLLLTPYPEDRRMVAMGLLRQERPDGGACCITAAGLRALADEMDAGRVKDGIDAWADMKKAQADA